MATALTHFPSEAVAEPGAQTQTVVPVSAQDTVQVLTTPVSLSKLESSVLGTGDLSIFERQVFQLLPGSPIQGSAAATATFPDSFLELDGHNDSAVGPTVDDIFSPSCPPLSESPQPPEFEFRLSPTTGRLECSSPIPSELPLTPLPPPPTRESDDEEDERRVGSIVRAGISSERVIEALRMESRLETVRLRHERDISAGNECESRGAEDRAQRRVVTTLDEPEAQVEIGAEGVRDEQGRIEAPRMMERSYAVMHSEGTGPLSANQPQPTSTVTAPRMTETRYASTSGHNLFPPEDATRIHARRTLTRGDTMASEEIVHAPKMVIRSYARMGSPKNTPAPSFASAPASADGTDIPAGSLCPPPPRTHITMDSASADLLEKKLQEMDKTARRNRAILQAIQAEERRAAEMTARVKSRSSLGLGSIRSKFSGLLKMRRRSRSSHSSGSSSGSVATPESRQALFRRVSQEYKCGVNSESRSPGASRSHSGSRRSSASVEASRG